MALLKSDEDMHALGCHVDLVHQGVRSHNVHLSRLAGCASASTCTCIHTASASACIRLPDIYDSYVYCIFTPHPLRTSTVSYV